MQPRNTGRIIYGITSTLHCEENHEQFDSRGLSAGDKRDKEVFLAMAIFSIVFYQM